MSEKKTNEIKVMSEKEINQRMAGFKASYSRRINQAKTTKERASLEKNKLQYLNECMQRLVAEKKKSIQRMAGVKSWETRRANQSANEVKASETHHVVKSEKEQEPVAKKSRYSSSVKVKVVNKKAASKKK